MITILKADLSWSGELEYDNSPQFIILHHAEASKCTIQDIHQWHLERGWIGCGYQFFVDKQGNIYQGRPENAQGAHCPGFNIRSIGICAEGAYETETMPTVQKNAILALCAYIKGKYSIQAIYGHRQVYETSCPGANYPLNEIVALAGSSTIPDVVQPDTPVSPSSRTWLQVGDSGSKVVELQSKLNELGFSCGSLDGDYGKLTKNAVYNFQNAIGINADGLAGGETFSAINAIISSPTDGADYPHMEYPTRYIQYRVGVKVDGYFGSNTAQAVKTYQSNHKLTADGVVGPATWNVLIPN